MSDPRLITTPERLAELCERLADAPALAFDTEFVPEYTFAPQLCLIQVATDKVLAAIDPLVCGDLTPFWNIVVDPNREVVVHAGKEEMSFCRNSADRTPQHLFDVQLAAGLVGLGYPLSLDNLLQKLSSDHRLKKTETRTDWRKRPLSTRQIDYALDDVKHLLD